VGDRCLCQDLPNFHPLSSPSSLFLSFFLSCLGGRSEDTTLMWGWAFLEQTQILSGIQFTRHFIEFVVVKTKRFASGDVNAILTRQACGQRFSTSAGSKRRALENHFYERLCHMFLIAKCVRAHDASSQ